MTFATTRAAGRVSTGMVAGRSNENEVSCNFDTQMILTPQPNNYSTNHKRTNSSTLSNKNNGQFKFPNQQAPKLYNGSNRNFESRTLASHTDRRSMLQLSHNTGSQKMGDFKSVRYSVASPNNEYNSQSTTINNNSYNNNQNLVKVNAFTQNLEQKVRYMIVRQQQKYRKTDTLNLKSKNNDSFDVVSGALKNRIKFNSNTGTSSLWDASAQPKQYSTINKSSIQEYNFITNERKPRVANNNSFQNIFGQTSTSSFRRQKGFSNFIHNARNTSVNMNPEYQKKMSYFNSSTVSNSPTNNNNNTESPFKRSGGMCAKMLDISHLNTFLAKPFKR